MHSFQLWVRDVCVDLCRREIAVSELFLDGPEIGSIAEHFGRKRVPERVRTWPSWDAGLQCVRRDQFAVRRARQPPLFSRWYGHARLIGISDEEGSQMIQSAFQVLMQ